MRKEKRLETIIRSELGCCHKYGPHAVWPHTAKETTPALLSGHADKTVDGVVIVSALSGRKSSVVLHPHVKDVGWITSYATKET